MQHVDGIHSGRRGRTRLLGRLQGAPLAAFLLAAGLGCSDEGDAPADALDAPGPARSGASGAGSPMYALSTRVRSPDSDTSYLIAVDSLSDQPNIDLANALELPGVARAYGPPGTGKVYLTSGESGTMTEVTYDASGAVALGRVVSFVGLGVAGTTGGNVNAFLSPTKAYHVNQGTLDVIVWNPESMTITGSFSTGLDVGDGLTARIFQQEPIVVGDRLLLLSFQVDPGDVTEGITTLTVIDTTNDQVISSEQESRCSHFTSFAGTPEGDLYFASNWVHAANYFLFGAERVPHPPCMLRIRAGETSFDREWSRSLEAELGTPIWAGLFPGTGDHVLVQGLSQDLVVGALETGELRSARPWTWYEVLPGGEPQPIEADSVLEGPLSVAGPVDDDYYLTSFLPDIGTSTLVRTTAEGGIRPGIEVPGQIATVVRVF